MHSYVIGLWQCLCIVEYKNYQCLAKYVMQSRHWVGQFYVLLCSYEWIGNDCYHPLPVSEKWFHDLNSQNKFTCHKQNKIFK